MFHAEDHLRLTGASQPLPHARVRRGLRVEARNTDVNAFFRPHWPVASRPPRLSGAAPRALALDRPAKAYQADTRV